MPARAARLLAAFALLLACSAAAQPYPAGSGGVPWRVVLIRSWDSLYPMNTIRERALRDAIVDDAPRVVEFFPEEIDPLRFPEMAEPAFVAVLAHKYRETPIDVVIASGIEPLEFAARHREAIWPGATIVFNGIFEGALDDWRLPPRTTGVVTLLDIEGTLGLGRALVPRASHVYVVSGSSPSDQSVLRLAAAKLERTDPQIQVHYVVGLTRAQASSLVSTLKPDSLVLYLTMLRDGAGQVSGPAGPALQQIAASSSVPVVSPFHTQIGRGVAGVVSPRFDAHGRAAGELARRILQGADPASFEVKAIPRPSCDVDWNALVKWQIPERNVPPGCSFINRPLDPLRVNFWLILAGASIILLQGALLGALTVQSRRRRIAEARLQARIAEIAQESRMSMIGALTANIAHEINQPMGAILSNTEAAQMMLEQGTLTPEKLREILADIRSDDLRASGVIRTLRKVFAPSQWKLSPLDANVEVAEALRHVSFEASRFDVTLTPVFASDIPAVMGDPVQLQQVVINLAVNAIEAVSDQPGGQREVRIDTQARAGGVEIAVVDKGPGLTPEDAGRLFDAPFTTKKDGMGFGLAIVRSIVEMHRGRVWFEPNVPRGAIFHVWLPAIS